MTNRKFGVEIECGFHQPLSISALRSVMEGVGLTDWTFGHDGTYIETRTPHLSGRAGLNILEKGMTLISELGGYVTVDDGLHVHHDAPEFVNDFDAILKLVRSWHLNQPAINQMVDESRADYHDVCPPWDNEQIRFLEENRTLAESHRNTLNIASLSRLGTIEIRQHEGTLDYDEAEAWILFGQTFIENVLESHEPTPDLGSTDKLLAHIKLAEKSGAFLRNKAASRVQKFPEGHDNDRY